MMLVLSKEKVIETEGEKFVQKHNDWLKDVYDKEVKFNRLKAEWGYSVNGWYYIRREWCVEKDENEVVKKKRKKT